MTGEMSMPPRLGSTRRIGRSSGSVMRHRKSSSIPTKRLWRLTMPNATNQLSTAWAINSHI